MDDEFSDEFSDEDITVLRVAAHAETTSRDEIQTYVAAVHFVAFWLEKQDGAAGHDTSELFDQFKENVCLIMAKGAVRT